MGLDSVEIVMEMEDRFDISLPDEECSVMRTVGDLARAIQRRLGIETITGAVGDTPPCLAAVAFHRLRRAWANEPEAIGIRLRPSTPLAALSVGRAGWWARKRLWILAGRAGVDLPELRTPARLGLLLLLLLGAAGIGTIYATLQGTVHPFLALMGLTLAGTIVFELRSVFKGQLPRGVGTIADAIRARDQTRLRHAANPQMCELEVEIINMVGDQLGVNPATITLESRFAEDLGMV